MLADDPAEPDELNLLVPFLSPFLLLVVKDHVVINRIRKYAVGLNDCILSPPLHPEFDF